MQDQQRRLPSKVLAGLSTLVLLAGGGTAFYAWQQSQNQPSSTTTPNNNTLPTLGNEPTQPTGPALPSPLPNASKPSIEKPVTPLPPRVVPQISQKPDRAAQAYWLRERDSEAELAQIPVQEKSDDPAKVLSAAVNQLLSSPPQAGLSSAIPPGTQLRSLKISPDGGIVYIDLSQVFATGGGSESMTKRLGQVLYTATSVNPNAKVYLSVEGKQLETLGGEGVPIDQPMTRTQFDQGIGTKSE